ncbi:Nucleoside-diphosphate-sugar epimerase OS=Streptomyces violarus OX=67380 GN=FHS41_004369 PE=4 SV=1 [Streptomyces violarus]
MRVLVTGGSGFLGQEICRRLVARGTTTSSLGRRPSPALEQLGVRQHLGDLADPAAVSRALAGCDAVIHNAALAGVSGPLRPYWRTNVVGTRNVIDQCRAHGIGTLVYTSTASVVFRPGGLENADERCPYPRRHLAAYPRTKAHAEALVLAADGPALATVSLRPHIIWGPGDPHFAPALARAVRAGRLVMPGDGTNLHRHDPPAHGRPRPPARSRPPPGGPPHRRPRLLHHPGRSPPAARAHRALPARGRPPRHLVHHPSSPAKARTSGTASRRLAK